MEVNEATPADLARAAADDVPPGYKRTEVGVVPEDWKVLHLSNIGETLSGLTYRPDDVAEFGTLVLRASNIQDGRLWFDDNVFVAMELPSRVITRDGDILICVRNGSRDLIGKCALITKESAGSAFGAFMAVFRSTISGFAFYQFQSDVIQRQIHQRLGATINQITNRDMSEFLISVPPIEAEQRAIAEALSDVDGLIAALDKLIAKKRAIKQAAMQQLLTGKTRLPGFSGEWETKRLINECELITKGTTPTSISRGFTTQGVNFVKVESITSDGTLIWDQVAHIDEETHTLLKRSQLKSNDILFSIAGALGRNAIVHESWLPANTNQALAIIRLRSSSTLRHDFLVKYLASPQLVSHVEAINVKAAQANISLADVGGFTIRTPSPEEQTAIATVLSDMDAGIAALEARRDKVKRIKQGMMQQLLTGRVRLVKPLAEEARA